MTFIEPEHVDAPCDEHLFTASEEEYGPLYHEHLLAQYHRFIESVWFVGETKQKVNSYFLSINTILLAALGVSFANVEIFSGAFRNGAWHVVIPFIGVVLCLLWFVIIRSYKHRSDMKLRIIHCIEDRLPIAPYTMEAEMIRRNFPGLHYYEFKTSSVVPLVFLVLYLALAFFF